MNSWDIKFPPTRFHSDNHSDLNIMSPKPRQRGSMLKSVCYCIALISIGFTIAILVIAPTLSGGGDQNLTGEGEEGTVPKIARLEQQLAASKKQEEKTKDEYAEVTKRLQMLQTQRNKEASVSSVSSSDLSALQKMEKDYVSTLRSCLGANCFDEPIEPIKLFRVGILAPPSSGTNVILDMLLRAGVKNSSKLEVLGDTHVPPYGYGKNHGWSRIVRLVRRLPQHAFTILEDGSGRYKYQPSSSASSGKSSPSPEVESAQNKQFSELYTRQIKQLMRWHCRLNHVAAHTSMLTIFLEDLVERPTVELEKILTYLGYKVGRQELLDAGSATFIGRLKSELGPSFLAKSIPEPLHSTAVTAIDTEMRTSKDMTKWPCANFREINTNSKDPASVPLPTPASALAANCTGAHVKCSVRFDVQGG